MSCVFNSARSRIWLIWTAVSPDTNFGVADGVDKQRGYDTFANLTWRDWSFTAMVSKWEAHVPLGWYETIFNSSGNKVQEGRSFVEAAYSREFSNAHELRWRLYYDYYRYWGRFDYDYGDGLIEDNRDLAHGKWVGSRLAYSLPVRRLGRLTFGGEVNVDLLNFQDNVDVQPEFLEYLSVNAPNKSYGIFLQQEWNLSPDFTAYFGARFDDSQLHDHFISPRVALVYKRSPKTTYKLLYGRAFRNPNSFEKYYEDHFLLNVANPMLGPEKVNTVEFAVERKLKKRLNAVATFYRYWLSGLIEGITNEEGSVQYQNLSSTGATGAEFELNGRPADWLRLVGSVSVQKPSESGSGIVQINSPRTIANARFAVPVFTQKLHFSSAFRYLSARRTLSAGMVDPVYLSDITFTTNRLHANFDLRFGIRNIFDRRYYDPVGAEHISTRLPQNGRTAFVKLIWHTGE